MPIRINLLAEALNAEDLRRRDPVKRAIFTGAFLLALALAWSSTIQVKVMLARNNLSQVQAAIKEQNFAYTNATVDLGKIADARKKLSALQTFSATRFLQGNLLNALQQIIVPNVQLTRVRIDQAYLYKEGTPTQTNSSNQHMIMGRAPVATEKIMLFIDARDFSANPGDQVNKFKDTILKQPYFQAVLDKTNSIRLSGLSAPQSDNSGKPFVLFTLECRYPDQSR